MRAAVYARVSTNNHYQDPEVQLRDIRPFCQYKGWEIVETYIDRGVSGAKERRPSLNRLMADAEAGKFDVVVVWKFDRFARSATHMLKALEKFQTYGIAFASVTEQIDSSTAMGKCMFTVIAAIAEMERSNIVERIHAGLRNAKAKGTKLGRRFQHQIDLVAVRDRIATGESVRSIAKTIGVSNALLALRLKESDTSQGF
jgi:DNA invertase Pin-like site-specific DNA recombinase